MPSYTVKYEENIVTITDRSFKAFSINERELDIFNMNNMNMFFRPTVEKPNRIKYTAPSSIPFDKYIKSGMNEHKLYSFIARITEIMSIVEKYDFLGANLILDDKLIFINELNDKIYMLYRPLNNRQAGGNVYGFLDNLILKIKKYNAELTDACDELHVFFADVNHYKVSEIVELLNRVYPRIYREIKAPETEIKVNKLDTIIDSRGNDGTTFLDISSRTSNGNEIKEKIKSIIKLIAKDNSCIIDVNKDEFIVGKSREKADGIITGNSMISRVHASIIYKEGRVYIKDLGSANGTFVDGKKLIDDIPVLLNQHSIIKLADQEFLIEDCCGALVDGKKTEIINIYDLNIYTRSELIALEVARKLSDLGKSIFFLSSDVLQSYGYYLGRNISFKQEVVTSLKIDKNNIYHNSVNSILHDGNLDLYPVFPGPLYSFNIDIEFYKVLLNEVVESSKYDYVIVDSRGFSDFMNISRNSDLMILITNENKYTGYISDIAVVNSSKDIKSINDADTKEVVEQICQIL